MLEACNIKVEVNGSELTLKVDLSRDLGRSKSGKSTLVASTFGNVSIPEHPEMKLGLNLYK